MIENLFTNSTYWQMYIATVLGFLILYFGFAEVGEWLSKRFLPKHGIGESLGVVKNLHQQKRREIFLSLQSIAIFGLFGVLPKLLYEWGWVDIRWEINWILFPVELIFLFFWNDFHFYCCHWLLHRKWWFRKIHYLHHQSHIPTVYSTYSFHWLEAFLLSTVMIIPMFFCKFNYVALLYLPVMSLFINILGHWHYDLFPTHSHSIYKFTFNHSKHHSKVRGNFGFFLPIFDQWFGTEVK